MDLKHNVDWTEMRLMGPTTQSDVIRTFFTADIGQSDVIGIDVMGGSETITLSVTASLSE